MPTTQLMSLDSRDVLNFMLERLETAEGESYVAPLVQVVPSDREEEIYKNPFAVKKLEEWSGQRQAQALAVQTYRLENKVFETTLVVSKDELRRDKTAMVAARIGELADAARLHPEELMADEILNLAGTVPNGLDGTPYFGANHPTGGSTTQTNNVTATQIPSLNVVSTTKPTAAEMAEIIADVLMWQYRYRDVQARSVNRGGKKFALMFSPELGAGPITALTATMLGATLANPVINAMEKFGLSIEPMVNAYLTTPERLYFFRLDGPSRPFIQQEEVPLSVEVLAEGSDHFVKNREHLYTVEKIYRIGYWRWQSATRMTLS